VSPTSAVSATSEASVTQKNISKKYTTPTDNLFVFILWTFNLTDMNIALMGYGKMGKAIESIALDRGHEVVLKIDKDNRHEITTEKLREADVMIEFTSPETAVENILFGFESGIPVISGSTGWMNLWGEVEAACHAKGGGFLYASNFSVGVNIFFELNKMLARLMSAQPEYNVRMEEIHHTEKKDAPSGTAITLAQQILEETKSLSRWVSGETNAADTLSIISHRIDPAPGTHTILYDSDIDRIEITHTAHSRKGFALGAVLAAEFMKDKKGIYAMKDVLKISA
jgi:4-hydroxy-tetrahydrodipicolinate reductase